jgi:hypothetical protein
MTDLRQEFISFIKWIKSNDINLHISDAEIVFNLYYKSSNSESEKENEINESHSVKNNIGHSEVERIIIAMLKGNEIRF